MLPLAGLAARAASALAACAARDATFSAHRLDLRGSLDWLDWLDGFESLGRVCCLVRSLGSTNWTASGAGAVLCGLLFVVDWRASRLCPSISADMRL